MMPSGTISGAPLSVLIGCTQEDLPAVAGLERRLRADGFAPMLAAELTSTGGSPRKLRAALNDASAVIICLSRRGLPAGKPLPAISNLIELLELTPVHLRLTIVVRLTTCDPPPALQTTVTLDLFTARGYERLLETLQAHAAAVAPRLPEPPVEPPPPTRPASPAVLLSGDFGLPGLDRQGMVRRLGRGVARAVFLIDNQHALVVSGGGPSLMKLAGGPPLWVIDCPTRCAALSPGERLLALGAGQLIYLWDLVDGSLRSTFEGHGDVVTALTFAPDARTLASASRDHTVRLWRTGDDGRVPTLLTTITDHTDQVTSVAFHPDGTLLAAGGADRTVRVWRMLDRTGLQTLSGHGGAVEALAFSPDGLTLAAGSRGRQVRLWETRGWRLAATLDGHDGAVESLAFSPDSALLVTGSADHQVRLWRRTDGTLVRTLGQHAGPVAGVAFSPEGDIVATVAEDDRLLAWRHADGTEMAALRPLSGRVTSLAVNTDGTMLAICGSDATVTVYDLTESGGVRLRRTDHRAPVVSVAFGPGPRLITAGSDRTIRACTTGSGETRILMQTHGAMHAVRLSPDGRLLASSDGEGTVQIWRLAGELEPANGQFWRVLRGLRGRPRFFAFDQRTEAIAVASDDGSVRLWRLADLEAEQGDPALAIQLEGGHARSLALSADGTLLAAGTDTGTVTVWRTHNGGPVASLAGASRAVTSLAFAPDGQSLATGDSGGTIQVWRFGAKSSRRRSPAVITGHAGAVEHLTYHPTGSTLVSGAADGTVRVWRV